VVREFRGAAGAIGVAATRDGARVVGAIATPCGIGAFSGATASTEGNGADDVTTAPVVLKVLSAAAEWVGEGQAAGSPLATADQSQKEPSRHDENGTGDKSIMDDEPGRGLFGSAAGSPQRLSSTCPPSIRTRLPGGKSEARRRLVVGVKGRGWVRAGNGEPHSLFLPSRGRPALLLRLPGSR